LYIHINPKYKKRQGNFVKESFRHQETKVDVKKVGEFLKSKRKQAGITQSYVAEKLGISPQAVSKWERGENLPDVTFFPDIAALYSTTIEAIIGTEPKQTNIGLTNKLAISTIGKDVFEELINLLKDANKIEDMNISLDFFPYLAKEHKQIFLTELLIKEDYVKVLEDIIPYATNSNKTSILSKLLQEQNFDEIEEIITFLNRKQRDAIVDCMVQNKIDQDIVDNFIPFFDNKQAQKVQNMSRL
jgi:transcriptional regulator with XRE-family HTH domain